MRRNSLSFPTIPIFVLALMFSLPAEAAKSKAPFIGDDILSLFCGDDDEKCPKPDSAAPDFETMEWLFETAERPQWHDLVGEWKLTLQGNHEKAMRDISEQLFFEGEDNEGAWQNSGKPWYRLEFQPNQTDWYMSIMEDVSVSVTGGSRHLWGQQGPYRVGFETNSARFSHWNMSRLSKADAANIYFHLSCRQLPGMPDKLICARSMHLDGSSFWWVFRYKRWFNKVHAYLGFERVPLAPEPPAVEEDCCYPGAPETCENDTPTCGTQPDCLPENEECCENATPEQCPTEGGSDGGSGVPFCVYPSAPNSCDPVEPQDDCTVIDPTAPISCDPIPEEPACGPEGNCTPPGVKPEPECGSDNESCEPPTTPECGPEGSCPPPSEPECEPKETCPTDQPETCCDEVQPTVPECDENFPAALCPLPADPYIGVSTDGKRG